MFVFILEDSDNSDKQSMYQIIASPNIGPEIVEGCLEEQKNDIWMDVSRRMLHSKRRCRKIQTNITALRWIKFKIIF